MQNICRHVGSIIAHSQHVGYMWGNVEKMLEIWSIGYSNGRYTSYTSKYVKICQPTLAIHQTYVRHTEHIQYSFIFNTDSFSASLIHNSRSYEKCKAVYVKLTPDIHRIYVQHITMYAQCVFSTFPYTESCQRVQNMFSCDRSDPSGTLSKDVMLFLQGHLYAIM